MGEKQPFRAAIPEQHANALLTPRNKAAATETVRKPKEKADRA